MNIEDFKNLNSLLRELQLELKNLDFQLQYHKKYIDKAEEYSNSILHSESDDFKVFSPRKPEIIYEDEIKRIESEKERFVVECNELEKQKEVLEERIHNIEYIIEHEEVEIEHGTEQDAEKEVEHESKRPKIKQNIEQETQKAEVGQNISQKVVTREKRQNVSQKVKILEFKRNIKKEKPELKRNVKQEIEKPEAKQNEDQNAEILEVEQNVKPEAEQDEGQNVEIPEVEQNVKQEVEIPETKQNVKQEVEIPETEQNKSRETEGPLQDG